MSDKEKEFEILIDSRDSDDGLAICMQRLKMAWEENKKLETKNKVYRGALSSVIASPNIDEAKKEALKAIKDNER